METVKNIFTSDEEFDLYYETASKLIELIKEYLIEIQVIKLNRIIFNKSTLCIEITFTNNKGGFNIMKNTKWEDIKFIIDKIVRNIYEEKESCQCNICMENFIYNIKMSCEKCYESVCIDCFYEICKKGEGIFNCPFCRYSLGVKQSSESILNGFNLMRLAYGIPKLPKIKKF